MRFISFACGLALGIFAFKTGRYILEPKTVAEEDALAVDALLEFMETVANPNP